jgi:hypothetical protein
MLPAIRPPLNSAHITTATSLVIHSDGTSAYAREKLQSPAVGLATIELIQSFGDPFRCGCMSPLMADFVAEVGDDRCAATGANFFK